MSSARSRQLRVQQQVNVAACGAKQTVKTQLDNTSIGDGQSANTRLACEQVNGADSSALNPP